MIEGIGKKLIFYASHLPRVFGLLVVGLLMTWMSTHSQGSTVTKISWDSRPKQNRFILQFDQAPKYNVVDVLKDKGYFYIDVYGLTTDYKRKLLKIEDQVVKYVDAICYADHDVLRLVFYTRDSSSGFKVSRSEDPPRIIIDTVNDGSIELGPDEFKSGSGNDETRLASLQSGPEGAPSTRQPILTNSLPGIPEPGRKPYMPLPRSKKGVKNIIIDPGHGGANSGASSAGLIGGKKVLEKELTLQFAYHLKKVIDQSPNMVAFLTRTDDTNVSLEERVRFAEQHLGDLFISLHMNDGNGNLNARGVEFYYLNEKGTVAGAVKAVEERENTEVGKPAAKSSREAPPLIKSILTDLNRGKLEDWQYEGYLVCKSMFNCFQELPYFRQHNRGVKSANFVVLKNFYMPAVLVEVGFMTNKDDLNYLVTPQFQQATSIMIYNAISAYFAENDPNFQSDTLSISSVVQQQ